MYGSLSFYRPLVICVLHAEASNLDALDIRVCNSYTYITFSTQSAYAKYVKEYYVGSFGVSTQTYNQKYLKETSNDGRLWWFQVCTEVAYFQIAPANDSIRSSMVDTKYVYIIQSHNR